jgi:MFS family permease
MVFACLAIGMFMVAIEATIVSTAMPSIVGRLGGFKFYSWVFTAFLLTQAATTVMFGKLADLYGRRSVLVGGIALFLVGSLLCGFAWSIGSLIAFRLLQGLGAGSIMPVTTTLMGDLYTPAERATRQGYVGSVWGISAVVGPLLGAVIVERFTWQWIFWMNIPIGLLTIAGLMLFLHEDVELRGHKLDLPGAGLFLVSISALLVVLTEGAAGGRLALVLGCAVLFVGAGAACIRQENRAAEPMIPLALWGSPLIAWANAATLGAGMVFMGATSFLPVYMQGVMGRPATQAGVAITMMSLGWPLAVFWSRWILGRRGVASSGRIGAVLVLVGAAFFPFMSAKGSMVVGGVGAFFLGAGMGLLTNACTILVQSSVDWSQRGAATSSSVFARTLGGMLGVALLGGGLNTGLQIYARRAAIAPDQVRRLLDQAGAAPGRGLDASRHVLDQAMHATFWLMLAITAATLAVNWVVTRHAPADMTSPLDRAAEAGADQA